MTDKAVSALTSLTGSGTATGDLLYIVDISEASAADRSKKITAQELQNYIKGFPATIGVGGATPAASGAGISFPATQSASSDANTLDDYEEGTHETAVTCGTSGSVTLVGVENTLSYTKIGRQVTVIGFVAVTSVSTPVGYFSISLPFAIADLTEVSGRVPGLVTVNEVNSANISDFITIGIEGEAGIRVYLGDGVNVQNDAAEQLKANSQIYLSLTYIV
jgi:hypothetical protein